MFFKRILVSLAVLTILLGAAGHAGAQAPVATRHSADLGVLTYGPSITASGAYVTYTLIVNNFGPQSAVVAQLVDFLPEGTTFHSLEKPFGWVCKTPPVGGDGNVLCTSPLLGVNAVKIFKLTIQLSPEGSRAPAHPSIVGEYITNIAGVRGVFSDDEDPDNSWSYFNTFVID